MVITQNAPAKINLTLDVLGKRPDGYHELRMVTQTLALSDRVTVALSREEGFRVTCTGATLPEGERNLAARAARVFRDATGAFIGAHILIHKKIPVGAGLGGGSADAAAVLRALNTGLSLNLTMDKLAELGAKVGSDIPFCVWGGTKLVSGRGERVEALPSFPTTPVVVCKPAVALSTAAVFGRLDLSALRRPSAGDIPQGQVYNVLEDIVAGEYPVIGDIRDTLLAWGATGAAMTGTGSAVYGLYADWQRAAAAYLHLRQTHRQTFLTRTAV